MTEASSDSTKVDLPPPAGNNTVLRLFGIPAVVTIVAIGVYFLFGMIAHERQSVQGYLEKIQSAKGNRKWQAAFDLSRFIDGKDSEAMSLSDQYKLFEVYKNTTNEPKLEKFLVISLGKLKTDKALPLIIERMGSEKEVEVLIYSIWAISQYQRPETLDPISNHLKHEDSEVRKMAVYSAGYLMEILEDSGINKKPYLDKFTGLLSDEDISVRLNSAVALVRNGDRRADELLGSILTWPIKDEQFSVMEPGELEKAQFSALQAVGKNSAENFKNQIEVLAKSSNSMSVRNLAISILDETPKKGVANPSRPH
jgi:HEAT repeat protein